jgi:zinc D-Ala-D-Ala carboxypeptidase
MEYFTFDEFDSPDAPGSGMKMDPDFLAMLNHARALAGVPFVVTSGYRTKAHNEKVGGIESSAHTKGLAADIIADRGDRRFKILQACFAVGFQRVGISEKFIHVDNDHSLPQAVAWTY